MGLTEWLPFGVYGLALATALGFAALCAFGRRKRLTGEPPLINGWIPFLGEALNFRKNATAFLLILNKKHGDIFTVYMAAHHFTFLWASVGNTIPAIFWAIYYLLRHPEAFAVVRDEIDHLLQSTGQERRPGYSIYLSREQLDNLVYLESAINESFRLCSSSMNIRKIKENFILKFEDNHEVSLREGDLLAIFPPVLHMDPEIYEDPQTYKFDRFVENGKKKTTFFKQGKKLRYFLMPFGSGISMCPGRYFAMNEIKLFVILALIYFDMDLMEDKQLGQSQDRIGLGILLPDSDIAFRYKLRS